MSCEVTRGRAINCSEYEGGIKRLLIVNAADLSPSTVTLSLDEEVTGISGNPNAYEFVFDNGQAGATSTLTGDRVQGTRFYAQSITAMMPGLTKQDRITVNRLATGRPKVIVEDFNGNYWLYGLNRGLSATTGTIQTGTAKGDMYGYNLTLTGEEGKDAYFVDADVIDNDLTIVSGTQGS